MSQVFNSQPGALGTDMYFSFSEDWSNYPPYTWTAAQLESFLKSVWNSNNITGEYDLDKLDLTGPELWCSTADDLKKRSEYGGLLYEALTQIASSSQWESKCYICININNKFNIIKTFENNLFSTEFVNHQWSKQTLLKEKMQTGTREREERE